MSLDTYRYTPPEGAPTLEQIRAEETYRKAVAWTPPKGHSSTCTMQLPAVWRHTGCTCHKSALAGHLRKLEQAQARVRAERIGAAA